MSGTSVKALAPGRKHQPETGSPRIRGARFTFGESVLRLLNRFLAALLFLCLGTAARAQKWERLGPEGGMVVSVGASPSGNDLYVGTADGHVFGSADVGKSWDLRGRVGMRLDAVVTRIVVDPRNANRLLAAVWNQEAGAGGGVFESENQGKSWRLAGLKGEAVRALEMAPSKPEELVAGTRTGVFLSTDDGKSWARISPEGDAELKNLDSLAIDPRDPQVIYAGTYHLPWLTHDAGKTWKPVIAGIIDDSDIMSLRLDASNPDRVYMSACSGIYRSDNQGGQWTKLQGIPYLARRTQVIAQDAANPKTLYAGTTEGLWVTRDAGESWTRTTSKEWVVNSLVVLPAKNGGAGRVVMGTEGQGVLISDDAGASFAEANHGLTHVIVKQLVADAGDGRNLAMIVERGTAEILKSGDGGKSWSPFSMNGLDHGKPTMLNNGLVQQIYSSPWGWMLRLDDGRLWNWDEGRQSWKEWALQAPITARTKAAGGKPAAKKVGGDRLQSTGPMGFGVKDAIVATNQGLFRCGISGACQTVKGFGRGEGIRAIWIASAGGEIGVVMDGKFGWSLDGGASATWSDLPVAAEHVVWVDAGIGAREVIYLGTDKGVFSSRDEKSWQLVGGGLPSGHVTAWLRGSALWAASERDGGFYISPDSGSSWKRIDGDSERGQFTGIVETQDGAFLAGSQSEGLLRVR
jgi:photosystem II stability/assembly factor-like uncharacterized protein